MNRLFATKSLLVVAVLGLGLGACDPQTSEGTVTPGDRGTDSQLQPVGEFEGESIDELELRLQRLVSEQERHIAASGQDAVECEEVCELSRAICEVKTKMCKIADERVGDDEYQNLCRVAKQRCGQASDSCVRCVQHHQRQSGGVLSDPGGCEGDSEAPARVSDGF